MRMYAHCNKQPIMTSSQLQIYKNKSTICNFTASSTRPVHKPFFPSFPLHQLQPIFLFSNLHLYFYTVKEEIQNPCPFLNVIYVYDRKSWLKYNIDAFSLSETWSTYFSCHFQKSFLKKHKFPPGGPRSSGRSSSHESLKLFHWI